VDQAKDRIRQDAHFQLATLQQGIEPRKTVAHSRFTTALQQRFRL
jgi:hypothetical protein